MKKGAYILTPRFLKVKIEKIFRSEANARKNGFTEPTHYQDPYYGVLGKNTGYNTMIFAGYKKQL